MASRSTDVQRVKGPRVEISEPAARSVQRGHPWIYRDALGELPMKSEPGDVLSIVRRDGSFVATAMIDPGSALAARVLSLEAGEKIDDAWLARRLDRAIDARTKLMPSIADGTTNAYRVCNGEGDLLPGLVIDRYAHVAVVRPDGEAARRWVAENSSVISRVLRRAGITIVALRDTSKGAKDDSKLTSWSDEEPPATLVVQEHGMRMEVDLHHGQKTGAFLDQRENRLRIRTLSRGRKVLNLFSYAGGFSVAAALGGATKVTSVDIAHGAHATAQRSFKANDLDPSQHSFVTSDVETYLGSAKLRGERFDIVISDPPSYAPSEKLRERAMSAYRRLHAACMGVLAPGGVFCAASCSSHISATDFAATLDAAALGRADLRLAEMFGPPADHPTLPSWIEGRYLKFAVLV